MDRTSDDATMVHLDLQILPSQQAKKGVSNTTRRQPSRFIVTFFYARMPLTKGLGIYKQGPKRYNTNDRTTEITSTTHIILWRGGGVKC